MLTRPLPTEARAMRCERISERVAALVDPVTTRTVQWLPSSDGSRLEPVAHVVEHPPLIEQLASGISGSTSGRSTGPGSRPAANLETLSTLDLITRHAAECVRDDLGHAPASLADNLRRLAVEAHGLDDETLVALDDDVRGWWARARIATTWATAPLRPFVPCMTCGVRGDLRVVLEPLAAACLACSSTWDASTIGILGEHIRIAMADPIPDPALTPVGAPTSQEESR